MASNRSTLKDYFNAGDRPKESEFADLINSTMNLNEDVATDAEAEAGTIETKFITPKTAKTAVEKFAVLKVNNTLPTSGNIDIKNINGSSMLGTGNLDLATQADLTTTQTNLATAQAALTLLQSDKVDKEIGKGLSTNDYTTSEKNKLSALLPQLTPPTIINPTTNTETIVAKWTIPANYLTAGMSFLVNTSLFSAGTGTVAWKLRVGTTGTTSDPVAVSLNTSAAQTVNTRSIATFNLFLPNATTVNGSGYAIMNITNLGQPSGAPANVPVTITSVMYISVTATISTANANNKIITAGLFTNS
jgi:hypothetical protein